VTNAGIRYLDLDLSRGDGRHFVGDEGAFMRRCVRYRPTVCTIEKFTDSGRLIPFVVRPIADSAQHLDNSFIRA